MTPPAALRNAPAGLLPSELRLPALRSELGRARAYAGDAAESFGLDAGACFEFVCAVNEAVTNAIRHGASDEDGQIRLGMAAHGDRLTFAVHDCGTFVMPEPDPSETSEHGRGLALMASLVDEIDLHIDPAGTTVRLTKVRP